MAWESGRDEARKQQRLAQQALVSDRGKMKLAQQALVPNYSSGKSADVDVDMALPEFNMPSWEDVKKGVRAIDQAIPQRWVGLKGIMDYWFGEDKPPPKPTPTVPVTEIPTEKQPTQVVTPEPAPTVQRQRALEMAGMGGYLDAQSTGRAVEDEMMSRQAHLAKIEDEARDWKWKNVTALMHVKGLDAGPESDWMLPEHMQMKLHRARNAIPIQQLRVTSGGKTVSGGGYFDPRTNESYDTLAEALQGRRSEMSNREKVAMELLRSMIQKEPTPDLEFVPERVNPLSGRVERPGFVFNKRTGDQITLSELHAYEVNTKIEDAAKSAAGGDFSDLAKLYISSSAQMRAIMRASMDKYDIDYSRLRAYIRKLQQGQED